ncbi:hypothetical protein PROFUN_08001 [Planoprotostelium fungivorum]|uniref:Uncharacterized protein n=1 Tax=Planoprotostelium fungivorum TaxID=1890364 RepID=A0A2P6MVA7_9EUKA|nr:hypothetical protein PROFUN_08001 [Planoprotostelium fungivorum]
MSEEQKAQESLTLPAPEEGEGARTLHVGSKVALEDMGPVVVNENGTVSQIANWSQMNQVMRHFLSDTRIDDPQIERDNVNRILLKRNKQRLDRLKELEAKKDEQ